MKLYYFETSNPRKSCAVAKHLGSPVEFVRVDLAKGEHKSPDYLAINPNGKAPALVDGDVTLWESHAIMCYLAKKAGSDLFPNDERQIEVLKWMFWDTAHFSRHAGALYFENAIKTRFGLGEPDQKVIAESAGFFKQFAAVLDTHLDGRDHLVGPGLTVADFAVATILPDAEAAKLPLDGFGNIKRWHDGLMTLPAWADPFPPA